MHIYYIELENSAYLVRGESEDEAIMLLSEMLDIDFMEIYDFILIEENVKGDSMVLLH